MTGETLGWFVLHMAATAVMAASAAIQARRHAFDLFGAMVLAVVASLGGGTVRDLLIGRAPVFWILDPAYLIAAAATGAAVWLAARRMRAGGGRRLRTLLYLDAVALALFTLVGLRIALNGGISAPMAVVMGGVTGVAGGMLRDMLCGLTPLILKKDLYATLSLAGGALYLAAEALAGPQIGFALAFAAIALSRILVLNMATRQE